MLGTDVKTVEFHRIVLFLSKTFYYDCSCILSVQVIVYVGQQNIFLGQQGFHIIAFFLFL